MSEKLTNKNAVVKRLKYGKLPTFTVDKIDGAMLSHQGEKYNLTFFSDRPAVPSYTELIVDRTNGQVLNERFKEDPNSLNFERVLTSGVELDLTSMKAVVTLLLDAINKVENK